MSIVNKMKKAIKAAADEITKPETFSKGDDFENFVRTNIFPLDRFELIHKTHSFQDNKNDYIKSSLYPDFLFRCKETGMEFYVEAKFRSNLFQGKVEWAKANQLKRYKEINNKKPVILCLGLGGQPIAPEKIFLIPISEINYTGLFESFLTKFKFYNNKPVFSSYLTKLLK